jgi:Uma2 family endonuclease
MSPCPGGLALVVDGRLRVPAGIVDLETFRRWARSEERLEKVRLAYLAGLFWIDLTPEELYTHNQVKGEVARVLYTLARAEERGRYFSEGVLWSCPQADLSAMPDGLFISFATFRSERIRQIPGRRGGVVETEGTPDLVLEVVSDVSVEKDTVLLPELYRKAGVPEFWRVDARRGLRFEVFHLTETGYAPAQEPDGWWRSPVFGRSFQLTQGLDPMGEALFRLEVRG